MPNLVFYLITCAILCFTFIYGEDTSVGIKDEPEICSQKNCQLNISETPTGKYCNSVGARIFGRCCVSTKEGNVVLGIDLQNCQMTEARFSDGIKNFVDLLYISLEGNDIKQINSQDFHRNIKIKYLSLPRHLNCPGGLDAWNHTSNTTGNATICTDELDTCIVHNVTCPEHSHCVHSGIGLVECLCDEGYHGYKCMNQGKFPALEFGLGIAIPTVVLSALLWVTQRRYVKATIKKK